MYDPVPCLAAHCLSMSVPDVVTGADVTGAEVWWGEVTGCDVTP